MAVEAFTAAFIVSAIVSAILSAIVGASGASEKGLPVVTWFFAALILGPLALYVLLCTPSRKPVRLAQDDLDYLVARIAAVSKQPGPELTS